jgi:mono/diheme cytochrome c family protein
MDSATGIGMVSDGQLAREIRNGVNREGHISLPFMSTYTDMAEADLIAIISFLRTLPPAPGFAPGNQTNILGKIVMTYFLKPYAPKAPPPESLPPEPSVRYGEYLGVTLGGCRACHTERSMHTGRYLSPPFTGGLPFRSKLSPGYQYFSSNLTPDSATSSLGAWSEEDFIKRFRKGLTIPEAPMPWGSYMRMTDTDLRAMYRYFRSLKPVYHDCGKPSTLYPIHGRVAKAHGSANDPSEK